MPLTARHISTLGLVIVLLEIGCSRGYRIEDYPNKKDINTNCVEQANSHIKKLKGFLSYMNEENFMSHMKLFLLTRNNRKLSRV